MKKLILLVCVLVVAIAGAAFVEMKKDAVSPKSDSQTGLVIPELDSNNSVNDNYPVRIIDNSIDDNVGMENTITDIHRCEYKNETLENLKSADKYISKNTDRFTLSLPNDWYYSDKNYPSGKLVFSSRERKILESLSCNEISLDYAFGIYLSFQNYSQYQSVLDAADLVEYATSADGTIVPIFKPARTAAGHLQAFLPTTGGTISISKNLSRDEGEDLKDFKSLIASISLKKVADFTKENNDWHSLANTEWGWGYVDESDDLVVKELHETNDFYWFAQPNSGIYCPNIIKLDKSKAYYVDTNIYSCAGMHFAETSPLFLNLCELPYSSECFDFKTLKASNIETDAISEILSDNILNDNETFVHRCNNAAYAQICHSYTSVKDNILTMGVFKKTNLPQTYQGKYDPTQPLEFTNEKVRDITVDLKQFY